MCALGALYVCICVRLWVPPDARRGMLSTLSLQASAAGARGASAGRRLLKGPFGDGRPVRREGAAALVPTCEALCKARVLLRQWAAAHEALQLVADFFERNDEHFSPSRAVATSASTRASACSRLAVSLTSWSQTNPTLFPVRVSRTSLDARCAAASTVATLTVTLHLSCSAIFELLAQPADRLVAAWMDGAAQSPPAACRWALPLSE